MPFCLIGVPLGNQAFHHRNHLINMVSRLGLQIRGQHTQRAHILAVNAGKLFGDFRNLDALLFGRNHDLVFDISNVARINHIGVKPAQKTRQEIKHNRGTGIANMSVGIDRWPADIHRHPRWIERRKHVLLLRQTIVKREGLKRCICI